MRNREDSDHTLRYLPLPRFLHDLTIAQRVRFSFLVGAIVVVIISLVAAVLIRRVTDTLGGVVEQVRSQQVTVMTMKDAVSAENLGVQGYLITSDTTFLDRYYNGHDQFAAAAQKLANRGNAEDRRDADGITGLEDDFRRLAQQEIDLSQQGFPGSAQLVWQSEGQRSEQALRARLDDVVARSLQHLNTELSSARLREEQTRYIFAPVVALTAILALLTALVASRSITRRFERLERTVERIEQGDFRVEIRERRHDELGRLAGSIRDMARALETETRERDQLLDDRERANERISVLYDVAQTVNQSLDTNEVLRLALTRLLVHTRMRAGLALLCDDTGRFRVALAEGMPEEAAAYVAGYFEEDDAQQFASAAMSRDGVTRMDLRSLSLDSGPCRTAVAVPLRAKGNESGVLILATTEETSLTDEEARLIESLAKQIGTALEHARLYAQSRRLAAAEERNRLARELHDSVTQSLFSMSMMSQALPSLIERNQAKAMDQSIRLSELARGALAEMRTLILELRPAALQEMGLAVALERHVAGFSSREALEISYRVDGLQRRLPSEREEALFRITQEALNNIARHAQAKTVSVVLEFEPHDAQVTVTDDGVGLPAKPDTAGFGMISMRERAERLGGTLEVSSEHGRGVRVTARVPAPEPTTSIAG
jgi:signal transduction histidine kinase